MKITSPKLDTSHLTANEEALLKCQAALELKDRGSYEAALDVMRPIWRRVGERPKTEGLHPSVEAEVLFCVGILTCWIGSRAQNKNAQEVARNLISESMGYYESMADAKMVAAARSELGYCYWCEGAFEEPASCSRSASQN